MMPRDLRKAESLWRIFHDKANPRELIELTKGFPRRWCELGACLETLYSSDKWEADGDFVGYFHQHEDGVRLFAPHGDVRWAKASSPGISKWPDAGAVLGSADGFLFTREDDGKRAEAYFSKRALLCAFPDGSALFVWDPRDGVVALVTGDSLSVEQDGIEG